MKVLILHHLLPVLDWGCIIKQVSLSLVSINVNRIKPTFWRNKFVDHSSYTSVNSSFHAHGAATEKVLSLICRCVHGTTKSLHVKAHSFDRPDVLKTGANRSKIFVSMYKKWLVDQRDVTVQRYIWTAVLSFLFTRNMQSTVMSLIVCLSKKVESILKL